MQIDRTVRTLTDLGTFVYVYENIFNGFFAKLVNKKFINWPISNTCNIRISTNLSQLTVKLNRFCHLKALSLKLINMFAQSM